MDEGAHEPADEIEADEVTRAEPDLEPRAEEEEPDHVEEQVTEAPVQELVRDQRPRTLEDERGDELELGEQPGPGRGEDEPEDVEQHDLPDDAGHASTSSRKRVASRGPTPASSCLKKTYADSQPCAPRHSAHPASAASS